MAQDSSRRSAPAQSFRDVVVVNTNVSTPNGHITQEILRALRASAGCGRVTFSTYAHLVRDVRQADSPLLLALDGQRLNVTVLAFAVRHAAVSVLWTFDDPYNLNSHLRHADLFDLIFSNDKNAAAHYGSKGHYLPLAAPAGYVDTEAWAERKPEYDIFFCGTAWPNRVIALNKLIASRPQLRIKAFLTYNRSTPALPLLREPSRYVRSVSFRDFMTYAGKSRITLGLHRKFSGTDTHASSANPGPRVPEVAAAGSYQVCEAGQGDLTQWLGENNFSEFADEAGLFKAVDEVLSDDAARVKAVQRAGEVVLEKHTYAHRIAQILSTVRDGDRTMQASASAQEGSGAVAPSLTESAGDGPERPYLLFVVHNTIGKGNYGGLEIHQHILAQNLKSRFQTLFLSTLTDQDGNQRVAVMDSNYQVLDSRSSAVPDLKEALESGVHESFLATVLQRWPIELVHFFHFINNVPSMARVAEALDVPYVVSVHDFYTACQRFNLIDYTEVYCRNTRGTQSDCDVCLSVAHQFPVRAQRIRREHYGRVLRKACAVVFMSQATRDIMLGIYPELAAHADLRIHGAPLPYVRRPSRQRAPAPRDDGVVRFLVQGNLADHKGGSYLLRALSGLPPLKVEVHVHGSVEDTLRWQFAAVTAIPVHFHGRYNPGELDISRYDFSLHLSVWPETYCQTLSEAWAARLVPIVTDLGALGERVQHGVNGYKVDHRRPATLSRLLSDIVADPARFSAIRDNISDDLYLDQTAHADLYGKLYSALTGTATAGGPTSAPAPRLSAGDEPLTLSTLQRKGRITRWTARNKPHPPDATVLPNEDYGQRTGGLRRVVGHVQQTATFSLDRAGDDPSGVVPAEVTIRNEATLPIAGWVQKPATDRPLQAVAVIYADDGEELYACSIEPVSRPDVAKVLQKPQAADWAMAGDLFVLAPDEMVPGPGRIGLGWLDDLGQLVYGLSDTRVIPFYGA